MHMIACLSETFFFLTVNLSSSFCITTKCYIGRRRALWATMIPWHAVCVPKENKRRTSKLGLDLAQLPIPHQKKKKNPDPAVSHHDHLTVRTTPAGWRRFRAHQWPETSQEWILNTCVSGTYSMDSCIAVKVHRWVHFKRINPPFHRICRSLPLTCN